MIPVECVFPKGAVFVARIRLAHFLRRYKGILRKRKGIGEG